MPAVIGVSTKPGQMAFARMPGGPVVDGQVLREQHDPALRRVVGAPTGGALEALDAREGHHRPALAVDALVVEHAGDRVLGHEEGAGEVHRDHPVPLLRGDLVGEPAARHSRRVHHAAQTAGGGGDERFHGGLVGDVGRHEREAVLGRQLRRVGR